MQTILLRMKAIEINKMLFQMGLNGAIRQNAEENTAGHRWATAYICNHPEQSTRFPRRFIGLN